MSSNYLNQLFNLEKKVVVITGAGGYLCSEIARGFAEAGCFLALLDIRLEKVLYLENNLKNAGFKDVISLPIDVEKKEDHEAALKKILQKFDHIDILINGAGINGPTPFFEITLEEWYQILNSQLTGTFLGCQVFGRMMVEQGKGVIINISSASSGPPLSKAFTYSIAKSGIKNLTQNLGREWGTSGVRVNALRPGFFPTEWNRKNFITKEREQDILRHTPMDRFGDPKELVGASLWLASDSASFVTGVEITVDGGFSCMTI